MSKLNVQLMVFLMKPWLLEFLQRIPRKL